MLVGSTTAAQDGKIELSRKCQFVSRPDLNVRRGQMIQFVELLG